MSENQDYDFFLFNKLPHSNEIFHYTTSTGLLGIIETHRLWFTNINYLNDKSETTYTYELLNECVEEIKNELSPEAVKRFTGRCDYMLSPDFLKNESEISGKSEYYISSFSICDNSLNLWKYYTKNAECVGYNIGFNVDELSEDLRIRGYQQLYLAPICYDRDKQKEMLKITIRNCNEKIKAQDEKGLHRYFIDNMKIYSLYFKHNAFKDEEEFRIIIGYRNPIGEDNSCKFRTANNLIIPYIDCEFNKRCVTSIKSSPTNNKELCEFSLKKLALSKGYYARISSSDIPLRY